jgi:hypothetical protein
VSSLPKYVTQIDTPSIKGALQLIESDLDPRFDLRTVIDYLPRHIYRKWAQLFATKFNSDAIGGDE